MTELDSVAFKFSWDWSSTYSATIVGVVCLKKNRVLCVFFLFILDVRLVGRTSRRHTGFLIHLPSAVHAFYFSREKDSGIIPLPRRPSSRILGTNRSSLVGHFFFF